MIETWHFKPARFLFNLYIDRLLKNNFNNFIFTNPVPVLNMSKSLIITPNHFSWWDGFFIDFLTRKITDRKIHVMMLEEKLQKYWFFKFVGAYSISPGNPKSISESIRYTIKFLENTDNFAVIYPQGEISEFDKYPFKLKTGIRVILKKLRNDSAVLPVAFKIRYGNKMKPDILVRFGEQLDSHKIVENFDCFSDQFNENILILDELKAKKICKVLF